MGTVVAIGVTEIGAYAGFASVLGLAVLSALYFSQARDVKRLRDWAGRAPERDAEARARVAAATPAGQARQAQPVTPQTAQPAAAGGNSGGGNSATATPVPTPSKAPAVAAGAGAAAGAAAGARASSSVARPGAGGPGQPAQRPSGQTSILQEPPRRRWYRRIAPRYIALIVAGVLVVGGGIAVGAVQLLSGDDTGSGGAQTAGEPENERSSSAPLRPADVSVAVFNATAVPGLASQFGDKAQADGFQKDNVGNAPGGEQKAESVILYAPGKEREARLVARKFDISAREPADPESLAQAPQADVILVVGADNTQ